MLAGIREIYHHSVRAKLLRRMRIGLHAQAQVLRFDCFWHLSWSVRPQRTAAPESKSAILGAVFLRQVHARLFGGHHRDRREKPALKRPRSAIFWPSVSLPFTCRSSTATNPSYSLTTPHSVCSVNCFASAAVPHQSAKVAVVVELACPSSSKPWVSSWPITLPLLHRRKEFTASSLRKDRSMAALKNAGREVDVVHLRTEVSISINWCQEIIPTPKRIDRLADPRRSPAFPQRPRPACALPIAFARARRASHGVVAPRVRIADLVGHPRAVSPWRGPWSAALILYAQLINRISLAIACFDTLGQRLGPRFFPGGESLLELMPGPALRPALASTALRAAFQACPAVPAGPKSNFSIVVE